MNAGAVSIAFVSVAARAIQGDNPSFTKKEPNHHAFPDGRI